MKLTERCEGCNQLRLSSLVSDLNGERICIICKPTYRLSKVIKESGQERCEDCLQMFPTSKITNVLDRLKRSKRVCLKCAEPKPEWFCATIYHKEDTVKKAIRKRLQKEGLDRFVKKIAVAKIEQTRTTKNSWGVYTHNDKLLGNVTAEDYDEALHKAKATFEPKSQKGVFKPSHFDEGDFFDRVTKTYNKLDGKKRVVWECWSKNNKLLGLVYDRDKKRAYETATKLYGPKEKPDRTQIVLGEIVEVKLDKRGGKSITQNRKALKGYILIQCYNSPPVFTCIEGTPGVSQLLPYVRDDLLWKQVKKKNSEEYEIKPIRTEAAESDVEEGKISRRVSAEKNKWNAVIDVAPVAIDPKQVEAVLNVKRPVKPPETFNVGDRVKINGGMFNGQQGQVVELKDGKIEVEISLLDHSIKLPYSPNSLLK